MTATIECRRLDRPTPGYRDRVSVSNVDSDAAASVAFASGEADALRQAYDAYGSLCLLYTSDAADDW